MAASSRWGARGLAGCRPATSSSSLGQRSSLMVRLREERDAARERLEAARARVSLLEDRIASLGSRNAAIGAASSRSRMAHRLGGGKSGRVGGRKRRSARLSSTWIASSSCTKKGSARREPQSSLTRGCPHAPEVDRRGPRCLLHGVSSQRCDRTKLASRPTRMRCWKMPAPLAPPRWPKSPMPPPSWRAPRFAWPVSRRRSSRRR